MKENKDDLLLPIGTCGVARLGKFDVLESCPSFLGEILEGFMALKQAIY